MMGESAPADATGLSGVVVRLKLVGGVPGIERYPELLAQVGRYLLAYRPERALEGKRWIWTTDDPEDALTLETEKMLTLYRTSIGTRPWDGKPDRPITVFHVQVEKV
jgi:hypothetical protein